MADLQQTDPSRAAKWVMLASSVVALGFLVGAALRENVTAEWRGYQAQYRKLLAERAADDRGRAQARDYSIELRQISVPELKAVDRCVTCHSGIEDPRMAGAPLPFAAHSGKVLLQHPVDKFGCTVCHGGQGAATDFAGAKGDEAFWDYPLLPASLTQSSCAQCHDPQALPPGSAPLLVRGRQLFLQKGCGGCHKLDGKGGPLALALDNEGMKTKHQLILANLKGKHTVANWLFEHFRDPGGIVAGSQMKNPALTEPENRALTAYVLSLRQRDLPEKYQAPDKIEAAYRRLHPGPADGAQLYQQYCYACHDNGRFGRWDKTFARFVPAVRGAGLLRVASDNYLRAIIGSGRAGTVMPAWDTRGGGLSEAEIIALVGYLRSDAPAAQAATARPVAAALPEIASMKGDPAHGSQLFNQFCAGCHGVGGKNGIAPNLANAAFQKAADDAFLIVTIANGRPNTAMPAWQRPGAAGLSNADIADVVAYIRRMGPAQVRAAAARPSKARAIRKSAAFADFLGRVP